MTLHANHTDMIYKNESSILLRGRLIKVQFYHVMSYCRGHYVSSNIPGNDISAPKFSLCLPVPYVKVMVSDSDCFQCYILITFRSVLSVLA